MPDYPSNVTQSEAIRAFQRAGGEPLSTKRGKGSHLMVKMPDGTRLTIPSGKINKITLKGIIKDSGLTLEEFLEYL